ncbi:unnamed protein product, partial [Vitis vinifera]
MFIRLILWLFFEFPTNPHAAAISDSVILCSVSTDPMDASPIYRLPQDTLHYIFSTLPLRQIIICRSVCKFFYQTLTAPAFMELISTQPPLNLIALRPPHHHHHHHHHHHNRDSNKSLIVCNPLTRSFQVLPQLGSAWSRHGSVLVGSPNRVLVLTELATLYFSGSDQWLKFSSNLPSKPRSPILVSDSVLALCDVGSPWRSQWKLFACTLNHLQKSQPWTRLDRHEWGDVFDILRRPRLVKGLGNQILMVGGLKSSFSLNATGKGDWRWINGVPGNGDGLFRGFVFQARLTALP